MNVKALGTFFRFVRLQLLLLLRVGWHIMCCFFERRAQAKHIGPYDKHIVVRSGDQFLLGGGWSARVLLLLSWARGGRSLASPNFVAPEKSVGRVRGIRTRLYARRRAPAGPTDSFPHANAIHLIPFICRQPNKYFLSLIIAVSFSSDLQQPTQATHIYANSNQLNSIN